MGIENYSVTPGSNNAASPNGWPEGMAPSGVNDSDRQFAASVRMEFATTSLTATATLSIGAAARGFVHVIADAGKSISSFDVISAGVHRTLIFDVAAKLIHDATKMKIPGAANLELSAGDVLNVVSEGSGNWQVTGLARAGGYVPAGAMFDFGGTSVPSGYLGCDGSAVSRTTFAALFAAISTTWGVGDGATTFNVPNFQRRTAVGSGGAGTATLLATVGSTGGAETHTLSVAETPAHSHGGVTGTVSADHTHTTDSQGTHTHTPLGAASSSDIYNGDVASVGGNNIGFAAGSDNASLVTTATTSSDGAHTHTTGGISANHTHSVSSEGGGGAHNIMQPSAVVLKIIKF